MTRDEREAVRITEALVRRHGSSALRYINAGHKVVSCGNAEFRCVVCGMRGFTDADSQLDFRCTLSPNGASYRSSQRKERT